MTFFNTKEEVVEIQLTPYGKYKLSKGEFSPAYYEFYDDDIVYDSQYLGISEGQEITQQRIAETPRTKAQYTFEGADTRYKEYKKLAKQAGTLNVPIIEKRKNFSFSSLPISNSSISSQTLPFFDVKILNGTVANIAKTNSIGIPRNINEVSLENQTFKITVREKTDYEQTAQEIIFEEEDPEQLFVRSISTTQVDEIELENGKKIELIKESNYLLLDISEMEVDFSDENFEIFMYEVEYDEKKQKDIEKQLFFPKQYSNIVNNILLDAEEQQRIPEEITPEFSNYYFDILIDKQIPEDILCKFLSEEEIARLNSVEGYSIDCKKIEIIKKLQSPELNITKEELDKLENC